MLSEKLFRAPSSQIVHIFILSHILSSILGVYEHIRNRQSLSDTYPYFDATSERNVTSFVGQVTHLHCTVRDIGDRTVSGVSSFVKTETRQLQFKMAHCQ
jgi:hypothetical protein